MTPIRLLVGAGVPVRARAIDKFLLYPPILSRAPPTPIRTLPVMAGDALTPQTTWSQYVGEIYTTGNRPVNGSYDPRLTEAKARETMKDNLRACSHAQCGAQLTVQGLT